MEYDIRDFFESDNLDNDENMIEENLTGHWEEKFKNQ